MCCEKILKKNKEIVGEAVIFPNGNVIYHLWKSLRTTRYCKLDELKRKYKLVNERN